MRAFVIGALVGLSSALVLHAQTRAPRDPDIYLVPLSVDGGKPALGTPRNITHRAGYDNQPSFTPDSRAILYTSTREDAQSDIYRYDLATEATTRLTSTPESEYSATVMPGGKRFSVIRVEKDSTQRLWSFAMDGSDPQLVLTALRPVGYHAWIDADNLALFVLGRPNALVHAVVSTGRADTLARNIGRSLLPVPGGGGFSFVRVIDTTSTLAMMRWPGGERRDLITLPRGAQDVAWAPAGAGRIAFVAQGTKLFYWTAAMDTWTEIADLGAAGLTDLTRLAVSADGRWIAIVAVPRL